MLNIIRKAISNIPGWSTKRHIIVFESDDWGSIRTRSKKDYDEMLSDGLNISDCIFTKYDSLESNTDLERLFGVLGKYKDSTGRHPVFTPMCIVANPNFESIKDKDFTEYVYESMTETCKRYPNHDRVLNLWHEGIKNRLFVPALHGREHFNYSRWMENISTNKGMRIAFEHQSIGSNCYKGERIMEYLGAFKPSHRSDLPMLKQVVLDAGRLFEEICGYKPTHFIAPNEEPMYGLDPTFAQIGIKYMTNAKMRRSYLGDGHRKLEFTWLGKYYKDLNIINISRNGGFEPASTEIDSISSCMYDISSAFMYHKPCVLSSHRVNYIGSIDEKNATNGLLKLDELLKEILKRWPDVEFMTSTELGEIIRKEKGL